MSSFSGLSAILTVSLIALVTVQMLKDKFDIIENYGELDDYGNELPYTTKNTSTPNMVQNEAEPIRTLSSNLDEPKHGKTSLTAGDFFGPAYFEPENQYSGMSEVYSVYQANLNSATPTINQLDNIGSSTLFLPGPHTFSTDMFADANVNTGRAANLSLCSQNNGTFGVNNSAVASSLLPAPGNMVTEGFSDCDVTNTLSNQVFLSTGNGVMGTNTVAGSLRNGNQGLRSEPPNPVLNVGPWNTSSIFPDLTRRPLEGCGPSFGLYGNGPYGSGVPSAIAN